MEKMSEHDKAIRLCEGGIVEIDGHCVALMRNDSDDEDCYLCNMDSICHKEMADICFDCQLMMKTGCYLKLV